MKQPIFIRLENTLEAAMTYRNSPRMSRYSFAGVQLLPRYENGLEINPYPYIQVTDAADGIELEDVAVYVCDMCGDRLYDITDFFGITPFQDSAGLPQVEWKLLPVEFDPGYRLIYLEIVQGANSTVYSSPFMLTAERRNRVSRWDYRNDELETMLSTGLQLWFGQEDDLEETTTYDTASGGRRVSVTNKLIPYEVWFTSIINYSLFRLIKQMRRNAYVYCDLIKTSPFEAWDSGRLQDAENFNESELTLCRDYGNVYDPLYVAPIPPDPPVDPPFIDLIKVVSRDNKNVFYYFEFGGFDPSYLQYQYSEDGINWTSSTNGVNSPLLIPVFYNLNIPFKYRIYYPPLDLYSNEVLLDAPSIEITNITSPQSSFNQAGNNYNIYYDTFGFTPGNLTFEASTDGVTWTPNSPTLYYNNTGAANPRPVQTMTSGVEFKYFRIRYNPFGITSNVFNFEF